MEISIKHLVFIFLTMILFLYFTDLFCNKNIKESESEMVQNETGSNNTLFFLYFKGERSGMLVEYFSVTSMTIMSQLVVIYNLH